MTSLWGQCFREGQFQQAISISGGKVVKTLLANAGDTGEAGSIPGSGRSSGEGIATHSSKLAWGIPWTEEPGRQQSMGLQRVRHYRAHTLESDTTEHTRSQLQWDLTIRKSLGQRGTWAGSFTTSGEPSLLGRAHRASQGPHGPFISSCIQPPPPPSSNT